MDAPALLPRKVQQRPCQRRRYGENRQGVTAGKLADALLPIPERTLIRIWALRRAVQRHPFRTMRPDGSPRQDEDAFAVDHMPAGAANACHPPFNAYL